MDGMPFIPERSEGEGWCPPQHNVQRRTKDRCKIKSVIMFYSYILRSIKLYRQYKGFIDMLLELPDGYVIIDHKPHPMAFDAESYAAGCAGQLQLYRKAVETATGKSVKQTIIHLPNLGMCFEVK